MSDAKTHSVYLDPPGMEIEVSEDETVLEAAFRHGVMLFHGCKEGQCAACKNFLIEGDVQHRNYSTFALADYEKEEGFVLLCRAHVFSDAQVEVLHWDEDMLESGVPIQDVTTEVAEIEELTHDLRKLTLTLVDPPEVAFNPGQYMDLGVPGTEWSRAYSMANTPATDDRLEFIIKVLPGGKFSGLLDDELSPGDTIEAKGPYGTFTLRKKSDSDIIFIGGGAGMAPLFSLLTSMVEEDSDRRVTFYYGARTAADLILLDEMAELEDKLPNFEFVPALSEPTDEDEQSWDGEVGLITDVVERREDDLSEHAAYLCGPPPMIDAAIPILEGMGVDEGKIYYDKFTVSASVDEDLD